MSNSFNLESCLYGLRYISNDWLDTSNMDPEKNFVGKSPQLTAIS